jgi:hypothetical protein
MVTFVWSPIGFFERRMTRTPRWTPALAVPLACALLQWASTAIASAKMRPVLENAFAQAGLTGTALPPIQAMALLTLFGYPITYAIAALALVALDVVLTDSGEPRRLAQFAGLSFLSQLPYCVLMLYAAATLAPEALPVSAGATLQDVHDALVRYQVSMFATPLMSTVRLLSYVSILWLCITLAIALKVVARLRAAATISAALFLALVLEGLTVATSGR